MKSSEPGWDKLISEISRTNSLDWREFCFFKPGDGLSKNDQLAIRVCLDYESARESPEVLAFVEQLSQARRQEMLDTARRLKSRYVLVRFSREAENERFPKWHDAALKTDAQDAVYPPVACVVASWFPFPWLSAPVKERGKVVKSLAGIYDVKPLPVFDFPIGNRQEEKLLIATAQADSNTTFHVFAINREQTESASIAGFRAWLKKQPDISGAASRKGRVKIAAALRDLGCYRLLTKLDASSRQATMDEAQFKQSVPKLSEAKRRAEKRLRSLGYI